MNIYLDDNRIGPNNRFDRVIIGWEKWVICRSVENAKELLRLGIVDDLALDNDMGNNSETGDLNLTGKELVKWMVEMDIWPKGIITIHTQNIEAAKDMKSLIRQYRNK